MLLIFKGLVYLQVRHFDKMAILVFGLDGNCNRPIAPQLIVVIQDGALLWIQVRLRLKPTVLTNIN